MGLTITIAYVVILCGRNEKQYYKGIVIVIIHILPTQAKHLLKKA